MFPIYFYPEGYERQKSGSAEASMIALGSIISFVLRGGQGVFSEFLQLKCSEIMRLAQRDGGAYRVFELPDISGPVVGDQFFEKGPGNTFYLPRRGMLISVTGGQCPSDL